MSNLAVARRLLPASAVKHSLRLSGLLLAGAALTTGCKPPPSGPWVKSAAETSPATARAPEPQNASSADAPPPKCDLVCGGASVVSHKITPDESADYYTNEAVEKANATLDGMHDELLACYTARVKAYPKAHAFLTIDIVVGPEGGVQTVETQGGALLGEPAMRCIVERIKQGAFAPPPRGGTMRLQVPFTLRRVGPDETI